MQGEGTLMSGNRTSLAKLCGLIALSMLAAGAAQAGVVSLWDGITPAPNDSTVWSGLGPDGTVLSSPFLAISTGGNPVSGSFAGSSGLVAVQCPAAPSCSWTGGFTAGNSLVWAFDGANGVGSGPLTLGLGTAVLAGGLDLQADAPGAFTAQVEAFDASGASLGGGGVASDAAGDPVFIGVQDSVAEITSLVFSLTGCTGTCDLNDFAVGTLLLKELTTPPPPIPEPGSLFLLGSALLAVGFIKLRPTVGRFHSSGADARPC